MEQMDYNNMWINYAKTVSTFFRDFVILFIELVLSIMLIMHFRKFLASKSLVLASTYNHNSSAKSVEMRGRDDHFRLRITT